MYPKHQKFLILGLSSSGYMATEFLLTKGAETYIYDDVESVKVAKNFEELTKKGAKRVRKEELSSVAEGCDVLVLSPGIPIDHPLAVSFKRKGKAVVGETELGARYMRCPIVAVTGTNGKTTTVSLITQTLQSVGYDAHACGNIGTPMLAFAHLEEDALAIAEISSFQLETLNSIRPHISVVLNITEDHLNRHYNMENYAFLKGKLLKNASGAEYAVLNYDDKTVRDFADKTKAKVVWFSVKERVQGAYYEDGALYYGEEKILSANELFASGLHNVQNALATIATAKIMRVPTESIAKSLRDFKGVKHRLEKIATIDGVTFIDDSKATNVDASVQAVQTVKGETLLLLGGKNKGYDYARLFEVMKHANVVQAVLYGENRYELLKSARENGFENITLCARFSLAVNVALLMAKSGQTVLLSPASASFDEFSSYEERGDTFVEIIRAHAEKTAQNQTKSREEYIPTYAEIADGRTDTGGRAEHDFDREIE
ncbi:MAG: UDP-N-acetylmuramoyl-L-alanine--D-glutamate ligase [Clostridiales bacterium]|nr:UDP-N-acetylmuramoyl-L-alanine--D-glutamate ligase [Clostridiales bacterium]